MVNEVIDSFVEIESSEIFVLRILVFIDKKLLVVMWWFIGLVNEC